MELMGKKVVAGSLFFSLFIHLIFLYSSFHIELPTLSDYRRRMEDVLKIRVFPVEKRFLPEFREEPEEPPEERLRKTIQVLEKIPPPTEPLFEGEPPIKREEHLNLLKFRDILPPVQVEITEQEVIAFEDSVLREDIEIKPKRIIRRGRGIDTSVPVGGPGIGTEYTIPEEKPEREREKITEILKLEPEEKMVSFPAEKIPSEEIPLLEPDLKKFTFWDELLEIELYTYRPRSEKGFFLIEVYPKRDIEVKVLPKDIIFLVDCSKSIGEDKLTQFKRGISQYLNHLNPDDRFNLVFFRERPIPFKSKLAENNPALLREAEVYMRKFHSEGETDVFRAITQWFKSEEVAIHPYIILFISDGRPTIGKTDTHQIISELTRYKEHVSIFTYGAGSNVNRYLLQFLAQLNRGYTHYTPYLYHLERDMLKFYKNFKDPILVHLETNYSGVDEETIYPKKLPNLYLGGRLRIVGRFKKDDTKVGLRLLGKTKEGKKEVIFSKAFPQKDNGTFEIARLWALHRVNYLVGTIATRGKNELLLSEIESLMENYDIGIPQFEQIIGRRNEDRLD